MDRTHDHTRLGLEDGTTCAIAVQTKDPRHALSFVFANYRPRQLADIDESRIYNCSCSIVTGLTDTYSIEHVPAKLPVS